MKVIRTGKKTPPWWVGKQQACVCGECVQFEMGDTCHPRWIETGDRSVIRVGCKTCGEIIELRKTDQEVAG